MAELKLIEVKVFEKAKNSPRRTDNGAHLYVRLEGCLCHPDRYRFVNCWQYEDGRVQIVGAEGRFEFVSDYCPNFADMGEAWIQGGISWLRQNEPDRFVAVSGGEA